MITVRYRQQLLNNSVIETIYFDTKGEYRLWRKDNKKCGRTIISEITPKRNKTFHDNKSVDIKKCVYSIISVSYGVSEKTYDYLLSNHSGQKVVKDQTVQIITGSSMYQSVKIKHLNRFEKVPLHVTKQLILTSPTTAIIGLINRGGTT
ncbi:MAG: hypothetical protein MJZ20_06835 [Bacteroidaceae bacterium]|nr:hypothetical protein [Bacteroidaceae bacterium]